MKWRIETPIMRRRRRRSGKAREYKFERMTPAEKRAKITDQLRRQSRPWCPSPATSSRPRLRNCWRHFRFSVGRHLESHLIADCWSNRSTIDNISNYAGKVGGILWKKCLKDNESWWDVYDVQYSRYKLLSQWQIIGLLDLHQAAGGV